MSSVASSDSAILSSEVSSVEIPAAEANSTVSADSSAEAYTEELDLIVTHLETLDSKLEIVEGAAGTVLTYGVFYIPLIVLILSLWWFFRQFLERYI